MRVPKAVLFLIVIIISQYYFDLEKLSRKPLLPAPIPGAALKISDLGLHSAAAAVMWLYAIQEFPAYPKKLPDFVRNISEIDPKFSYPYAFAALILPTIGQPEQAIEIGRAGLRQSDPDWRIPYYLATTYHIFFKDRKNASLYFSLAAETPGAPDSIKSIAARYGTSADELEQTKQIWISLYKTSNDEFVIERAKNYIIHIEMIEELERAAQLYKQKFGYWPKNLDELVKSKILKEIPLSPLGVKFGIRADGKITVQ